MSEDNSGIWASLAGFDPSTNRFFTSDVEYRDKQLSSDIRHRINRGEPLPPESFAKEMYADYKDTIHKRQPHLFRVGPFWVVSSQCAGVLRQFDLGQGGLYPTRLFQFDRKTPVEGEYYCLNIGNTKKTALPEISSGVEYLEVAKVWFASPVLQDDELMVLPSASSGPDIWIDPDFEKRIFFLSDLLARALKKAKVSPKFGLRRCKSHLLN